jgi:hypothetical protein
MVDLFFVVFYCAGQSKKSNLALGRASSAKRHDKLENSIDARFLNNLSFSRYVMFCKIALAIRSAPRPSFLIKKETIACSCQVDMNPSSRKPDTLLSSYQVLHKWRKSRQVLFM